jgi:hypothetical protein
MRLLPTPLFVARASMRAALLTVAATAGCGSDDAPIEPKHGDAAGGAGASGGAVAVGVGGGSGGDGPLINDGFIGGPCSADSDCAYQGGFCLPESDGFPDGMCSLDCDMFCPDQDGAVETFCALPADLATEAAAGLCTTRCSFGQSPTGCRDGYQCQPIERFGDPETVVYACVPGNDAPFVLSACHQALIDLGLDFTPMVDPLDSPDGLPDVVCDLEDPILLTPVIHDVAYRPSSADADPEALFVSCPFALSLDRASEILAERGATDLVHYGTYNCRVIAGTTQLSEHGLARALDIAAVRVSSGDVYSVLDDWEQNTPNPVTPSGTFLKELVQTYFDEQVFNIILTPDYNAAHENHFHCDLTPDAHFLQ